MPTKKKTTQALRKKPKRRPAPLHSRFYTPFEQWLERNDACAEARRFVARREGDLRSALLALRQNNQHCNWLYWLLDRMALSINGYEAGFFRGVLAATPRNQPRRQLLSAYRWPWNDLVARA